MLVKFANKYIKKKSLISIIIILLFLLILISYTASAGMALEKWSESYGTSSQAEIANDIAMDSNDNIIITGRSYWSFLTIKYNKNGFGLWTKTYNAGNTDVAHAVTTNSKDEVIVTGTSYIFGYSQDYHTIKYNADGDELWHTTYNKYGNDIAYAIVTDSNDNIIVTGRSSNNFFTIKYAENTDGLPYEIWNVSYDSGYNDIAYGASVDSNNNIIITGTANNNYHTIKYDTNGNEIWNKTYNSGNEDIAYGASVDSNNNIIITGTANNNYHTIKYDTNGNEIWNKTYNSGENDCANDIAIDTNDNIIITGYTGSYSSTYDYTTIQYDKYGNQIWIVTYDSGENDEANGVAIDSFNNIVVTGGHKKESRKYDYYTIKYEIDNNPPIANYNYFPNTIYPDDIITFMDQSTDSDGIIHQYEWDFDDGNYASGTYVTHSYENPGIYNVTLTVIDNDGASNNISKLITVIDEVPPEIYDNTLNEGYTGDLFTFNASVIDDTDVENVYLEYWYNTDVHTNISMDLSTNNFYEKSITIEDRLDPLYYIISANDSSDNWNNTGIQTTTIIDDDKPEINNIQATPSVQEYEGSVNITCNVFDNIALDAVKIDIQGPNGFTDINTTMNGNYYYNNTYNILGTYTYSIWAKDTSENTNTSIKKTFIIRDTTPPEIIDNTPTTATTGDPFILNATVKDNVKLDRVQVTCWYENYDPEVKIMTKSSNDFYECTLIVENTLNPLYYQIAARDTSNNWNNTDTEQITINDNDPPQITDKTNIIAYTGNQFTFQCTITDNIQISEAYVEYWYNSGSHAYLSLINTHDNNYEKIIKIQNTLETLHYKIKAKDTSNNWKQTNTKDVTILDDDKPEITDILSNPSTQEYNGFVNITCNVFDNIELEIVKINVTGPNDFTAINTTMNENYFYNSSYSILGTYNYHIYVKDTSGNTNTSQTYSFEIVDTTKPEIIDNTLDNTTTGEKITFNATVADNVKVDTAYVEYWYGNNPTHTKTRMININNNQYEKIITTENILQKIHYIISANDTSDNWNYTGIKDITIIDNDKPTVIDQSDNTAYTGNQLIFKANVEDNIQIENVSVEYWYNNENHVNIEMTDIQNNIYQKIITVENNTLGKLYYIIHAKDTSDNYKNTSIKYVNITDSEPPAIRSISANPEIQEIHENVNITFLASDNIDIDKININITGPAGFTPVNITLDTFYYNHIYDILGTYNYYIWVKDTSGNTNTSQTYSFEIVDTTKPEIIDHTPTEIQAGNEITFKAEVIDNSEVEWAQITYGYKDPPDHISYMDKTSQFYEYTITATSRPLYYFIYAKDIENNGNQTNTKEITVTDNTPPEIKNINIYPSSQKTDRSVEITCEVTDNLQVKYVNTSINGPEGYSTTKSMQENSGIYRYSKSYETTGQYSFSIEATDIDNNKKTSQTKYFTIYNNPPEKPSNPEPLDDSINISIEKIFTWDCEDPDDDDLKYNIYFGEETTPPLVKSNYKNNEYNPGKLSPETTYYWKIVASDGYSENISPIWNFTTRSKEQNTIPEKPTKPEGKSKGYIGESYEYQTKANDSDGNTLKYEFNWGDASTITNWMQANKTIKMSHTWDEKGTYKVKVRAYDGFEWSDWSKELEVTIEEKEETDPDDGGGGSPTDPPLNNPPNKPEKPTGTTDGKTGFTYTYITSTTDPEENNVYYKFDWGDNTESDWKGPYQSNEDVTISNSWKNTGTYYIKVKAKDEYNSESSWSDTLKVEIESSSDANQAPNQPETPEGTIIGMINEKYQYESSTTDPDGDDLKYLFNWGDGSTTNWLNKQKATHSWDETGTYKIKVKAKDEHNLESIWSETLTVKIYAIVESIIIEEKEYLLLGNTLDSYEQIYNPREKTFTDLEKNDEDYLIDINGDGNWDYIYQSSKGSISSYQSEEITQSNTILIAVSIIILIATIIVGYFYYKNYDQITKTAVCPKCEEKVKVKGKKGQYLKIKCPNCKTTGNIKI